MSKETKVGLLVSLGVILGFALILSMRLSGEGPAVLEHDRGGTHMVQSEIRSSGGDAIDRELRDTGQTPEERVAEETETGETPEDDETAVAATDREDTSMLADAGTVSETSGPLAYRSENKGLIVVGEGGEQRPADAGQADLPEKRGSSVRNRQETAAESAPGRHYVVRPGDSLWTIAEKTYGPGKGGRWRRIAEANPDVDPGRLTPGVELVVPAIADGRDRAVEQQNPDAGNEDQAAGEARTYTVSAGDTLGRISAKVYGTCKKWRRIQEANGNLDPRRLRAGMELAIPSAATTRVAESPEESRGSEDALREVREFVARRAEREHNGSTYTVVANDTLCDISRKVFGVPGRWREIYELNQGRLRGPDQLRPGQVLKLPAITMVASSE